MECDRVVLPDDPGVHEPADDITVETRSRTTVERRVPEPRHVRVVEQRVARGRPCGAALDRDAVERGDDGALDLRERRQVHGAGREQPAEPFRFRGVVRRRRPPSRDRLLDRRPGDPACLVDAHPATASEALPGGPTRGGRRHAPPRCDVHHGAARDRRSRRRVAEHEPVAGRQRQRHAEPDPRGRTVARAQRARPGETQVRLLVRRADVQHVPAARGDLRGGTGTLEHLDVRVDHVGQVPAALLHENVAALERCRLGVGEVQCAP